MGRSIYRVRLAMPKEEAYRTTVNILRESGYGLKEHRGEQVWKYGMGIATSMHYIKVSFPSDQEIQLAGWVQNGVGSVGGKDLDLHGSFVLVVPRKSVKKTLAAVLSAVSSDSEVLNNPMKYLDRHDQDLLEDLPSYEDMCSGAPASFMLNTEKTGAAAAEGSVRFCPKCGGKIIVEPDHTGSFIFCSYCGNKLDL